MADRHTVIPRTISFVFNKEKVLLLKASREKEWYGRYDPVGGHIEKGESILDSARKEIREEAGLEVTNLKLRGVVHVTGFFGKEIMLFVTSCNSDSVKLTASEEGNPEWIDLKELDSIDVLEDIKPILKHVIEMKPEELFFGTSVFDGKDKLLSLDIKIS